MAGEAQQGRTAGFRGRDPREKRKAKAKWIPAFAGMTEREAFAGMTEGRPSPKRKEKT
jgi:hypothetical protein